MGINKCLKCHHVIEDEYDLLAFFYATFNMMRGTGEFYLEDDEFSHMIVQRPASLDDILSLWDYYLRNHPDTYKIVKCIVLDLHDKPYMFPDEMKFGRLGTMLELWYKGKTYVIPLGLTYDVIVSDHEYDPLRHYRKKSRGSQSGVSSLLNDLQRRLTDLQIDESRKDAAFRKLNSLCAECRKLGLMENVDHEEIG